MESLKVFEAVHQLASYFFLHKDVLEGTWLHETGATGTAELTSDGSAMVLLRLPQPVYDLGKYYLELEDRQKFACHAFSFVIHSFRNPLDDHTASTAPNDKMPHLTLRVGRGGIVDSPARLQRQLEESFNHVLALRDDISFAQHLHKPLFDDDTYPKWHLMELIVFGATFWSDLISKHDGECEKQRQNEQFSVLVPL